MSLIKDLKIKYYYLYKINIILNGSFIRTYLSVIINVK